MDTMQPVERIDCASSVEFIQRLDDLILISKPCGKSIWNKNDLAKKIRFIVGKAQFEVWDTTESLKALRVRHTPRGAIILRKPRLAPVHFERVVFKNGPFDGQSCDLENDSFIVTTTLPIQVRGFIGYYKNGVWIDESTAKKPIYEDVKFATKPKEATMPTAPKIEPPTPTDPSAELNAERIYRNLLITVSAALFQELPIKKSQLHKLARALCRVTESDNIDAEAAEKSIFEALRA